MGEVKLSEINYFHKNLKDKWGDYSLNFQMANIGSEVSRALKWKNKNKEISDNAVGRALELIDFTIDDSQKKFPKSGRTNELLIDRYVLCDYFYGDNEFNESPESLMKYYNEFAGLILHSK